MADLFSEYDGLVKSASSMANPQLRGSLYGAADTNPDEETNLQKLAKKTGLPVESLRNDGGAEARRRAAAQVSEDLPPATSSFLAEPDNARVAHDDAEKLAELERVARSGFGAKGPVSTLTFAGKADQAAAEKAREYVGAVLGGFKSSIPSFNAGLAETGRIAMEATGYGTALRSLSDLTGNETWRNIAEAPRLSELYWESLADEARVKTKAGTLPYYLQSASGSLGVSLMAAPFGMAGEGPALGVFGLSASGGQEDLTGAGYSEQQAAAVSIPKKIMEGLTEKIGLDALYKGGKPILKAMTEFVLGDLAGEQINTVYNAIADKVTIKPDMTWNDLGQEVVDTAIVTGLMGGMQGAAFHGSARAAAFLQGEFEQSRRTRAAVNLMESLGEATKESKTFQRMPEKLRDLIGKVTEDGPVENVYVPAEKIRELFQGKVAEPDVAIASMLDDPDSYYQALATGGDVVIPLPEYVEKWAGTEYHQALIEDMRLHPGDMTQRELKEWSGKMPEEFAATLKGLDEEGKAVAGDRKVYDEILGELLGAGRERSTAEREALLWQSRYRSRAERLGKDAWDLYQENPIRIKRPMPEFMTRRDFVDTSIDPFLDRLRSGDIPTEAEAMGTSLVEFLREKGMKDEGGELASLGADEGRKPFQKKLSREDGLSLDKAREAAAEAGYLPADSSIADFLDLVDQELRGAPVYAAGGGNEGAASLRLDMEQLRQYLESHGIDIGSMVNEEIRKALKGASYYQGALPDNIEIDGVERPAKNSRGELIAATEEGIRNFWAWFGDSKVVDSLGRPLVVYHGSPDVRGIFKEGFKKILGRRDSFFASDSYQMADSYADDKRAFDYQNAEPYTVALYLSLKNPMIVDAQGQNWKETEKHLKEAELKGHDGIVIKNTVDFYQNTKGAKPATVFSFFNSTAAKSAMTGKAVSRIDKITLAESTENSGGFDPENPNIFAQTYAEGKRGSITFGPGFRDIALLEKADLSTFIHESGHAWLEELRQDAAAADAPDQVRQDWETVAAWAGIAPDVSTISVEAHERFARAVEAYLMEGNAPSVELQPAFQRFKAWLLRIYRELRNLNVDLTDDVRRVLDRLLATDEEIKRAENLQGFTALFTDAAAAGMTEKEFSAYRKEVEKAHVEAETRLQQKLMAEITREQKAWWKEEREKVLGEVTAEAKQDPVYLAIQVLTDGKDFEGNVVEGDIKLSKADLVRMYGKEFVKKLPRSFRYLYAKEGGIHPDAAAEIFGFSSGDEMIRKMANTPPLKKFVEAETDVRMREVYGDMLNDGTIADEALKALHSDYQGQVLRAELRALRRKEREVAPFVKAAKAEKDQVIDHEKREREYERRWMEAEKKLAIEIERGAAAEEIRKIREEIRTNKEAARRARKEMEAGIPPLDAFRMWAVQAIGAKPVRAIIPSVYARAEQTAGKAAFEAAAKGDFEKAGKEKQTQLLNHYLYIEAVKAREDSEAIYDYARRLEKPSAQARIGKSGETYLDQINGILERYEFKKVSLETLSQRQTLVEWIQQQEELGLEPSIPEEIVKALGRKNYKELTIDELRAVRDALKNIEHLSREMNRIRIDNEEIELDLAIGELSASVTANFDPKRIPIDKETKSWLEKQGDKLSRFDASLIKAEQLVEWMDGGRIDGPWARMIFRPIAAAEMKEHALTLTFTKKLADLVEAYGKEKREALMEKVFIPSIGESITRQAAISAALNTGNESNLKKLLEGYGWQEGTLDEILAHLDADDWTFVQLTWDTIEELWPEISALEKRLTGLSPEKVIPREFTNNFGTWRGGYFPVVYDPLHSAAGEKQTDSKGDRLFDSSYVRATTEKGHTKARIEAAAYPILLSLEVIPQHIAQVIHDISHREAVVTANRLLNNKQMRVILNSTIGAPYYRMLKQWLATVANDRNVDRTGNEFWTRFMGSLRTNATIVGMGFRMSTMLAQIVGLSQSLDIVKGKYLAPAFLRFARHPGESLAWVNAKSGEMLNRRNSLDRDIRDGIRKMMGQHGAKQWLQAKAFAGIGLFDSIVSVPTWMGAYEQAKAEGLSEADAIESGDRAVRLSQGSGGAKDLAAVQRSNDFMKLFTMFYSYFSVLYNRLRNMGRLKGIGELGWTDVAWKSFIMVMVPAIMGELIAGRGPDDDDDKAWWAIRKVLAYPFMTIPFLRDIVNSTESGRPYSLTPVSRLFEMTAKLPSQVEAVANNQKDLSDLLFQVFDAPGYAFGLPTGQARTTTKYLWDLMEGDVTAEDLGDVLKGLAFGHHKKK